jgi:16S rRNA (guanine527-N7)-methyltransferase
MHSQGADLARNQLLAIKNVSRETLDRFSAYEKLLKKWNDKINLVGHSTLDQFWTRHLLDSAQLYSYIESPDNKILADFGSGAGFPGLVLAIIGMKEAHLIESDARKCSFLQMAALETGAKVQIHTRRIEHCVVKADIITARALAPLVELIDYAKDKLNPNGECMFLKGRDWTHELAEANKKYDFISQDFPSQTDDESRVVKIFNIKVV